MSKIIIDVRDDVPLALAVNAVSKVIDMGRISESGGIRHFCWCSTSNKGLEILTRRKKKNQTSDSFIVYHTK